LDDNIMSNPRGRTADNSEQTIRVEIYNQTYSIRSDGDNDYILELAEYVDRKMREISSGTLTVDSLKVAILAALHIADEYYQLKHSQAQTDAQLASRSAECADMLDRVLKHKESVQQEFDTEQ
jgi:cell division protein ZapA